ncbi:MAG: 3-keto-5-aminohexanoate cleavage protein [Pseudomonadales bacterium]
MDKSLFASASDNGLLINLAPVGIVPNKTLTPHVPVTHNETVETVASCLERGVQMVHLHCRDKDEVSSSDPELFGRVIESIRALPGGRELIVCVTTSGRLDPGFEARSRVLDLTGDMKPDMASLTLSSLNFMKNASVNEPDVIRKLAGRMLERGIKPELEIFDLGMANFANVLVKEGLIKPPFYSNLLLGNISGAQTSMQHAGCLLSSVPEDWVVSVGGIGHSQITANMLGIMYADGVRVGLEDSIYFDRARKRLATNLDLVNRVIDLAESFERPLVPPLEARDMVLG